VKFEMLFYVDQSGFCAKFCVGLKDAGPFAINTRLLCNAIEVLKVPKPLVFRTEPLYTLQDCIVPGYGNPMYGYLW